MGLILLTISIVVGCKDSLTEPKVTTHCTNSAYPLWCPNVKVCCTRDHAYYCDGSCYPSGCPSGTITRDDCRPE